MKSFNCRVLLNIYLWMDQLFSTGFRYSNLFIRVTIYMDESATLRYCSWKHHMSQNISFHTTQYYEIYWVLQRSPWFQTLACNPFYFLKFDIQSNRIFNEEIKWRMMLDFPPRWELICSWKVLSVWQMVGGEGLKNYEGLMMSAERKVVPEDTVRNICFLCTAAHRWVDPNKTSNVS